MSSDSLLQKNSVRMLYFRFRDSQYYSLSIISFALIISFLLIFKIVIPQTSSWFSIRDEVIALRHKNDLLHANINFMNNLDRGVLNSQLQTALTALPSEKNFSSLVTAITDSAIKTGVVLDDFSFQLGDVSSNTTSGSFIKNNLPAAKLILVIEGDANKVQQFVSTIGQTLPLSEVTNLDKDELQTRITILFYYKPLPKFSFHDEEPIRPLSESKQNMLQVLSGFQNTTRVSESNSVSSSGSAMPLF